VNVRSDFCEIISDELRAFLHIAGIEFRRTPAGSLCPFLRIGDIDWVLYLHDGDILSTEYWRQVVMYAYGEFPPLDHWIAPWK